MSETAIKGSPITQYPIKEKVSATITKIGEALPDPVEKFLKDAMDETKTAKSIVVNVETGINTAQIVKKVASGEFEPANNAVKNLITKFTDSKNTQNVAKFLTQNKAINFLEKSTLGKIVIANKEQLTNGISTGIKVLGVAAGGFELGKGIYQLTKGDTYEGGWSVAKGSATIVSALATGPLGFAGLAVQAAYIGDKATKEYGWHKDEKGNAESAVQHIGTKTKETYKKESQKNGKVAGVTSAAVNATGQTVVSAVSITGAFLVKTVDKAGEVTKKVGNKIDNFGKNVTNNGLKNITSDNLAKKVVGFGQVTFGVTTQAIGKTVTAVGDGLNYVADKGKKYVGQAVNYLEKKVDQVSSAVSNTVGQISKGVSNFASDVSSSVTGAWNSFVSIF